MAASRDIHLTGIGVSSGIVIAKVYYVDRSKVQYTPRYVDREGLASEIERFRKAVDESKKQLQEVSSRIPREHYKEFKHIIEAHLLILQDRMLISDTEKIIRDERVNAEWALNIQHEKINNFFRELDDEYLSERMGDVDYVVERIM
jgi:phosphoenolpyruvate-protein phosphotransferase (PTS system enzyme I)